MKKALFVGSNRKFEISSPIPDHLHRSCWKSSEINEDSPITWIGYFDRYVILSVECAHARQQFQFLQSS